jgi:chromosomal replication initiator protein
MSSSPLSTLSAESPQALDSWQNVKRRLRVELGEDVFTSWFSRLELNVLSGNSAHLS